MIRTGNSRQKDRFFEFGVPNLELDMFLSAWVEGSPTVGRVPAALSSGSGLGDFSLGSDTSTE